MAKEKEKNERKKEISVEVQGTATMELGKLQAFQGKLKYLPDENFKKLRSSILENGFRIPLFIWKNKILDGHQRVSVLLKLKEQGYSIPPIPVVELIQKSESEARKVVLFLNSRYGVISEQGFYDFAQEFDLHEIEGHIQIPEINFTANDIDFDDLDEQMKKLGNINVVGISVVVPKKHAGKIKEWLANGNDETGRGFGKGVMKRCGLR
jgi:hypothetical protein